MSDFNPPGDEILETIVTILRRLCWGVVIIGSIVFCLVIRHAWEIVG